MMKKIILGAGVFMSVVASTLGATCNRCGKEMVVESREPGMCIDCYRAGKYPICKKCHQFVVDKHDSTLCLQCFLIDLCGRYACSKCEKHAVGRKGERCYVCRRHESEGDKSICSHCKNELISFDTPLCSYCWKDSCYNVCPRCGSGELILPGRPMCKACWKKDDASLCEMCKEVHCDYGDTLCDRCLRQQQQQSLGFGCGGGFGCTDDYASGFGCDEPYGF